jgi:hypothetical protein
MPADGAVIAAELDAWGAPRVLADAFETTDPARVAGIVSAFCAEHLGAAVDRYEFFAGGVGTVHGVRLTDGRRVALKAHRAGVAVESSARSRACSLGRHPPGRRRPSYRATASSRASPRSPALVTDPTRDVHRRR